MCTSWMGEFSEIRLGAVRRLIEQVPDGTIRSLEGVLASGGRGDRAISAVHDIINAEMVARRVRTAVFEPIVPHCAPNLGSIERMVFPAAALSLAWRGEPRRRAPPDRPGHAFGRHSAAGGRGSRGLRRNLHQGGRWPAGRRPGLHAPGPDVGRPGRQVLPRRGPDPLVRPTLQKLPIWGEDPLERARRRHPAGVPRRHRRARGRGSDLYGDAVQPPGEARGRCCG